MNEHKVINYWCNFFGIGRDKLNSGGVSIVPHKSLAGYDGAWIFRRHRRVIFSVREKELNLISAKIKEHPPFPESVFTKSYIDLIFGTKVKKIIGPTFQGFYDNKEENKVYSKNIVRIKYSKFENEINALSRSGDDLGWAHSSLDHTSQYIYAFFMDNKILAIANYKLIEKGVGFIGVYTDPLHRSKGYGRDVVKKAVSDLMENDNLALYQTLESNVPSLKIASNLGIKEFGRNIAIRLKV